MRALAILLLVAGSALGANHPAPVEVKTAHFLVKGEGVYPEVVRSMADRLEEAYPLFVDRFGPLSGPALRPMVLVVYPNRRAYMEKGDGIAGAVGHYDSAVDRSAVLWRGETGEYGWPIAVHEACHDYLRRKHPGLILPSWYGEGIACWFEGLQDPSSEDGAARLRVRGAQEALEAGEANLDALLLARTEVSKGRLELQGFSATRYYALAWSFVHYMATDPSTREAFRRFEMRLLASDGPVAERETRARKLLMEECGDLKKLERGWRENVRKLRVPPAPSVAPVYGWELSASSAFTRYAAVHRLPREGALPKDLSAGLLQCLSDDDLTVRTEAARVAGRRLGAAAVPALIRDLDCGDRDLKRAALRDLADPVAKAAVPRLLKETEEKEAAVRALVAIGDPRANVAFRDALLDRRLDGGLRARCAAALASDPQAQVALAIAKQDPSAAVRSAACRSLALLAEHSPAGMLPHRKLAAATAAEAETECLRALLDPFAPVDARIRACEIAAELGARKSEPALQRLCREGEPEKLRLAAVRALVALTGETRGFVPGQPPREREAAYRAWADQAGEPAASR